MVIGRMWPDNLLFAGPHNAAIGTVAVNIPVGLKMVKRGTVIGRSSGGEYGILDGETYTEAEYINASDQITSGGSVILEAYISGDFYEGALIMADGYELTDNDRRTLRINGIYMRKGMPVGVAQISTAISGLNG